MAIKEQDYLTIKSLLGRGVPGYVIASKLKYGSDTVTRVKRSESFEDYKEISRTFYQKRRSKIQKQLELVDIIEEPKTKNEIILSKLEIVGTPHEISLFYQLAKKCGIESKLQMNAK